ncbi:class I SAM-dependent methyltransferase [Rugamonas apoptosis]|uniref:S-adenosyl-L-methionine-dependent methyltransferase n=1 Tax=Rugamonas apoptosis TaxID=2758570 RepID=A0A7W2F8E0_9BURK|nr:class I SAM-dependent methyltransferase [Rugamonas apoptosis]MBA5687012.1 class I SAM-dependent methyltransferase [Rugamonas apoptosis]
MAQASDTLGEGLLQQGVASRSALAVAMLRAAHQLLDQPPLFNDPVALSILGPEHEAAVRAGPNQFDVGIRRMVRMAMAVRSRLAEDELAQAVARGVTQYVVLGAGLDSYGWRSHPPGLQVFEVDHPATQAWKRGLLQQAGLATPANVRFVPVDFERDRLTDALRTAGCRLDQPVFFSWLGVTLYLTRVAIFDTLDMVAQLPAGSAIVFDYGITPSMLEPVEQWGVNQLVRKYAAEGEPWISFFAPEALAGELRTLGFSAVADFGPAALAARYLAGCPYLTRFGGATHLMLATV